MTYDGFGRLLSQSVTVGGVTRTTQFAYNAGDNTISQITYPSGRKAEYFYEHPILRTATRVDVVNGSARQTLVKDVDYGNDGLVEGYTLRSNAKFSQAFNLGAQISSQTVGTNFAVNYSFDTLGRINRITDSKSSSRTRQFTFDSVDALTSVRSSSNALLEGFAYNGNLDRTAETGGSSITPVYDANRKLTRYGTRDFAYNGRGNMSAWESTGGVTSQIGYDARGLSRSYQTGGTTQYLDRDESGALIMVKRGAYQDHYSFAGSQLLHERNGQNGKQTDYIYLNGQLVGIYDGQLSNVITGHLGQPQAMYSETGALVWRGVIDGFDIKVSTQTRQLKARFPGQYDIVGNGVYYNYFRDYDPKLGRYVQSDPIGLAGGMNTYGYVGGNPVEHIDPTGEAIISARVCLAVVVLANAYSARQKVQPIPELSKLTKELKDNTEAILACPADDHESLDYLLGEGEKIMTKKSKVEIQPSLLGMEDAAIAIIMMGACAFAALPIFP